MKKIIGSILIILILLSFSSINVYASSIKAQKTSADVMLDGKNVFCRGFNVLDNNYYMLRDLAERFNGTPNEFDVVWNAENNNIEIISGQRYTNSNAAQSSYDYYAKSYSATPTSAGIFVDDKLVNITAYNINGNNYFKLRDLGNLLHFDVEWDGAQNKICVFTEPAKNSYKTDPPYLIENNIRSVSFQRWGYTLKSHIIKNDDDTISVINVTNVIRIDTYDRNYNFLTTKTINFELPKFGCFYSGEKYNYIAFGQNNLDESDDKEVIRIVRYDKNFRRIDSVSVNNCYTIYPFGSGAGRMAENGDTLVFHTDRTRYQTEDGLNHQSQLTVIVDLSSMEVINDLGPFQKNHVSHSFDQYVLFEGNSHVLVDHGDGYPRAVVLNKGNGTSYNAAELFEIPGSIGANCTGVSIGGFESSSDHYIVAMNTIDHSLVDEYTSTEMEGLEIDQRDIIICALPKNSIKSSQVKQITLAKYVGSDKIATVPHLVKISNDRLMVLWQEYYQKPIRNGDLKYVFIDKNGNPTDDIKSIKYFKLSNCKPIVIDNAVVWYYDDVGFRVFNTIPLN